MRMSRSSIVTAAAIGLVAAGGSAFTAANSGTPLTSAGQASTVTTGFAVSLVDYTLAPVADATGDQLASVSFTLTAATNNNIAAEARVQLVSGQPYFTCTPGTPTGKAVPFVCDTTAAPGIDASAINTLNIVAVSDVL